MRAAIALCALLALPAAAQSVPPASTPFGGCSAQGNFCAGPAVSLNLVTYGFRSRQFTTGVAPGVGYQAAAWADKWYTFGLEGRASIEVGAQTNALFAVTAVFAHYLRAGPSIRIINGSAEWGLAFGIGLDVAAMVRGAGP